MAGIADQSAVTMSPPPARHERRRAPGVRFALATPADDSEVRRLLRENPIPGRISIALEREPDANLAANVEGDVHHTIVARDERSGRLIAMGSVSVRDRYVNGEPTRVGYLGQLRLDHACRGRGLVIRRGYEFFRELHETLGVKLYLTSIASDNVVARRLLERGLPGMPTYRPLCEFVTTVFRRFRKCEFQRVTADARRAIASRGLRVRHGDEELLPGVRDLLNASAPSLQFAPVWLTLDLPGLRPSFFRVAYDEGRPCACAAIWDQREMKQAIVRSYSPALRWARVPLNMLSRFTRLPYLPRIGDPLRHAFVSHVATPPDEPDLLVPLIALLHGSACTLGVDCLTIGFDARDPRLTTVRRAFRGHEYRTRLYVVHWPDGAAAADVLDRSHLVGPEVALL